jgi:superfamily I DNA/RNA helicase
MKLTDEQKAIIAHHGNARIKAGAGTGKTSTLLKYALSRPNKKILYIAYNRSVKDEALYKFKKAGIRNVQIETAHSLAYKDFDVKTKFKLHKDGGHKPFDLLNMDEIKNISKTDSRYGLILSKHVLACMNLFCNSSAIYLSDIDYLDTIQDETAKNFVRGNYDNINHLVSVIMNKMLKGQSDISHDAYLKYWQLSKPRLDYDIILFDEGQDASPVMLEAFLNQDHATKIIVGDEHQQIYSFRSAVNSLNHVDYPEFYLTNSFRFPQNIADTAMQAINLKTLLDIDVSNVKIVGLGTESTTNNLSATLARNNLTLLIAAIEAVFTDNIDNIYFEGNLSSYTYMKQGGNLYDILNLSQEKHTSIKDPFISTFKSMAELEEYQETTSDQDIKLMTNIVKKYGGKLSYYLTNLKKHQVEKQESEMIFSTVHKAKGMEYKNVTLCEDFITKDKILELLNPTESTTIKPKKQTMHDTEALKPLPPADPDKIAEEINILYVAITRTQESLVFTEFD